MVLTAYNVLSLVTGLFCHHRVMRSDITCVMRRHHHRLDASVGASGPHDFAVRVSIVRRVPLARPTLPRPPHPVPNVRDDRDTPLQGEQDGVGYGGDLGQKGTWEYF